MNYLINIDMNKLMYTYRGTTYIIGGGGGIRGSRILDFRRFGVQDLRFLFFSSKIFDF